MKVRILVVSLVVALLVGFGLAYAKPNGGSGGPSNPGDTITVNNSDSSSMGMPVTVGDSMVIVVGPTVSQQNWFCATQTQSATQSIDGSTQTVTGGSNTGDGGKPEFSSTTLGLVGNVALGFQLGAQVGLNENESNMYSGVNIGSFNRISRVQSGRGRSK